MPPTVAARPRGRAPGRKPLTLEAAALAVLKGRPADAELARAAGLPDTAALTAAFARELRLAPDELARLGRDGRCRIAYGGPFHVAETLRYLGRDPDNLAERVEGATYRRFFPLGARQVPLALTLHAADCELALEGALAAPARLKLVRRIAAFLGLDQPLAEFYRAVRDNGVMAPLVARLPGVRIPQVPSLWEALGWAIIGQQINLAFAYRLRNRFIALGNGRTEPDGGLYPFPTPEQVLRVPEPAWRTAQFSRQKIAYLRGAAEAFASGTLTEDALRAADADQAAATLRAVKGLGPWSVAYSLLRALGQVDALPVGDAGLRAALRHHYRLPAPPDVRQQESLMAPFRPYRGLATYYFWKSLAQLRQE